MNTKGQETKSEKHLEYEKGNGIVKTHNKFVYCCSLYKIWDNGASLVEEKYYSSPKPLKLKKKDVYKKLKDYKLVRFFELEFAPEDYLINNGYKLIEYET